MRHFLINILLTTELDEGYITIIINTKENKHFSLSHVSHVIKNEYPEYEDFNINWFKELSQQDAEDFNTIYEPNTVRVENEDIKTCVACGVSYAVEDRDTDVTGYCSFKCMLNDVS
tara:strand:+ start:4803 stop:5150 length:348 start_codon:yes stop_codon:yes gene_type:complete